MLRGLIKLTWLEIKIFLREPLGAIGTFAPVVILAALGRFAGRSASPTTRPTTSGLLHVDLPVLVAVLIATSAVLSLITIVAIYREGGILKRLRATPLRPHTILTAHVLVKLALTVVTLALMVLVGLRSYALTLDGRLLAFTFALVLSTWSILAVGFVIASIVPTARFAQPIGAAVLYPMVAISGIFAPVASLSPGLRLFARALPMTSAVSLLQGMWSGDPWSAHLTDVGLLVAGFAVCTALSARVFRWE